MSMFTEEIERGMAVLDKYDPDWIDRVVLTSLDDPDDEWDEGEGLDMSDVTRCVVGQVFLVTWSGHDSAHEQYRSALRTLAGWPSAVADHRVLEWGREHGFETDDRDNSYARLTTAWADAILARRSA